MTTPGQPPPSGDFIFPYGDGAGGTSPVRQTQTDWTTGTIQGVLKGTNISTWTNAQNTHNENVAQPIIDNANQLGTSGTTLTNHENRLTKLEDGSTVFVFYTNDTWHKPSGYAYHKVIEIGGSGGGGGGQNTGSMYGGQGGGQGGWTKHVYADSDLILSSYTVTIGSPGAGAFSYYTDHFMRSNGVGLGSNWRTDSAGPAQILSNAVEAGPQTSGWGENGYWSTWVGGEMLTDNVNVQALIVAPHATEANDNLTGIYLAAPTTYSSSSKIVAFVSTTAYGGGIFTQDNQVSAPYNGNGGGTGQTIVANTSVNLVHGQMINLKRVGNVFTAYINGAQVCSWTDTGNTVPTGVGNRHFGMIHEGNFPTFGSEVHSPAIGQIVATDIDPTPGSASTFSGGTITLTAGGGAGGLTYNTSGPAAEGSGTEVVYNAGGGTGGTNSSVVGTAGGDGVSVTGGAPGPTAGDPGSDGGNIPTGNYGVGAGAGAGAGGSTVNGGKGGNGGFPGGGGGGGGATTSSHSPGGGGAGSSGFVVIISSNSSS